MSLHGGNYETLRKVINELELDLTKINENRKNANIKKRVQKIKIPLEDIITGNHNKEYQGARLKDRLISAGYKEHKCERCGLTEWLGQPIPLQLHHKDGNHSNNLLENIELLCPNCHVLTDNFGGKNVKHTPKKIVPKANVEKHKKVTFKGVTEDGQKLYDGYGDYKLLCPICKTNFMNKHASMCRECYNKDRLIPKVSKELLYKMIDETNNYNEVARQLNVEKATVVRWHKYYAKEDRENGVYTIASDNVPPRDILKKEIRENSFREIGRKYGGVKDNTVKKWCVRYDLPHLKSEINNISDEDWINI